jgi:8-oxo-dGTP diphosphatase
MPVSDQGITSDRYQLIPRTLIFLIRDEHVLLLNGAANKRLWPNRYNGIGGHIEMSEDVLSSARRELLEESGYDCPDLWLCGIVIVDTGKNPGIGIYIFRGILPTQAESRIPPNENGEIECPEGKLEWVTLSDVFSLPLVEDLPSLLPTVLTARQCDPPFSAISSYDEQGTLRIKYARLNPL